MLVGCSDSGVVLLIFTPNPGESIVLSKHSVPFTGSMDGFVSPGGSISCDPGWTNITTEAEGEILHCGKTTMNAENCSHSTSQQGGVIENGFGTLTAANGDIIYIAYSGTYVFDTFPPTMSTFSLTGIVIEGSGRFEGVTGSINAEAVQDFSSGPPWQTSLTWTGTIEY